MDLARNYGKYIVLGAAVLSGVIVEGYRMPPAGTKTPAEAIATKENDQVVLKFRVASTYVTRTGGHLLINNYVYRKGEQPPADGITVFVPSCGMDYKAARTAYVGKEVEVTGTRGSYRGKPQIKASLTGLKVIN